MRAEPLITGLWLGSFVNTGVGVKAAFLKVCTRHFAALAVVLSIASTAFAQESLLMQAARAWETAELTKAADLYDKALKDGGLQPSDVLVAYTRIGTVRAATGRTNEALSCFRSAAALDPSFELPLEAGPKARALYKKARATAERQGGKLEITADVPDQSAPDTEFSVVARIPETFVPLINDVGITVSDPSVSSMKPWTEKKPAEGTIKFEIPGKVVIAGANLLVRVDALDGHNNRWASTQSRVQVAAAKEASSPDPTQEPLHATKSEGSEQPNDASEPGGGSFWSSPWPWIIGGVVVAGVTASYFLTRPTEDVTVVAPHWR